MSPGLLRFLHPVPDEQADLFAGSDVHADPGSDGGHQLFDGGPPARLQTLLGLMTPERPNVARRAGLAVAIGWLPLAVLAAAQSVWLHDHAFSSFLTDYGVHARSLIAAPLFVAAEAMCLPRLSAIALYFSDAGIVSADDAPAFRRIGQSTLRLRDSMQLEIALLALAITIIVTLGLTVPVQVFPPWHRTDAGVSPAGWWHNFVSVPILLILLLGWLWRLMVWTRFLYLVSRLKLRIMSAHPDRAGGLRFVGMSLQAFSPIAFAVGTILAGAIANRVMHDGAAPTSFRYVLLGFAVVIAVLFAGPLMVFIGQLVTAWRRGMFEYGALARSLGAQMERRWLNRAVDARALDANDFSATTDLYSIVSNVYAMNVLPLGLTNLIVLITATVLPFLPVVLMSVSPAVIVEKLMGIFL